MKLKIDLAALNRRYGPIFALGSGIATVLFFRRGASFAPAVVAGLVFAWTAAAAASRWLAEREGEHVVRRLARFAAGTVIAGMYQDALFYLVPLWFGSATLRSANISFPIVLSVMALFSCFEHAYKHWVLDHPAVRALWSAVVLFATVVAVIPGLGQVPIRETFALAGAISALASGFALVPLSSLLRPRGLAVLLVSVIGAGAVAAGSCPLFPPVPIRTVSMKFGLEIEEREVKEAATHFEAGTPKVYAWFAINAPKNYKQPLVFQWFKNGDPIGKPFVSEMTGGRESGYRAWTTLSAPGPGGWRIDLSTETGQLIGRESFSVP